MKASSKLQTTIENIRLNSFVFIVGSKDSPLVVFSKFEAGSYINHKTLLANCCSIRKVFECMESYKKIKRAF